MTVKILDQHIESSPEIAGGKPCIAGRRITVQNVVIWHEWLGRSSDEIVLNYDLMLSDVYAALAYYYDHQQEIDETIQASDAFVEAMREQIPSQVAQKLNDRTH